MSLLHTIVAFIVALGVLIVVHEYGHYLAARLCRVKVLRFSVGFGRPLATWRLGADRTEWSIAAVPFGGYVKMLDEREGPVEAHEAHRASVLDCFSRHQCLPLLLRAPFKVDAVTDYFAARR